MARLPQVGGDSGNWGAILNDFLSQSFTPDGFLKTNTVGAPQITDGSISEAKLDSALADKVNAIGSGGAVSSVNGETGDVVITKNDLALGNVNNTSDATKNTATATLTNKDLTSGTNTFPTFNQNTTGSAATLTTSRTIQTNLSSTSSASFNGSTDITPGVTGTLGVSNGGTGRVTATTPYGIIAAGTTATGSQQTIAPGTSGHFLKSAGGSSLASFSAIDQADVTNLSTDLSSLSTAISDKQDTLTSGTNIKTVNGEDLLGSGNLTVGDVSGPASTVNEAIAVFDGTTGKLIKRQSGAYINSGNALTINTIVMTSSTDGIKSNANSGVTRMHGGLLNNGAAIVLGGSTNATIPNTGYLRVGASSYALRWNESLIDTLVPIATVTPTDPTHVTTKAYVDSIQTGAMGTVVHGATASTARPTGYTIVTWIGSIQPTNALTNDIWIYKA